MSDEQWLPIYRLEPRLRAEISYLLFDQVSLSRQPTPWRRYLAPDGLVMDWLSVWRHLAGAFILTGEFLNRGAIEIAWCVMLLGAVRF